MQNEDCFKSFISADMAGTTALERIWDAHEGALGTLCGLLLDDLDSQRRSKSVV